MFLFFFCFFYLHKSFIGTERPLKHFPKQHTHFYLLKFLVARAKENITAPIGSARLLSLASHNYPWWHTDSYCLSFLRWEKGQRGERRSWDAFTVFFMTSPWLHLLLQGWVKRKRARCWEELPSTSTSPPHSCLWSMSTMTDALCSKRHRLAHLKHLMGVNKPSRRGTPVFTGTNRERKRAHKEKVAQREMWPR